jgi:hypothetical protein
MVTISDTTPGATIYYTTDGSTPSSSSSVYTTPIAVKASETITAFATATGYVSSALGSATYTINLPTFGLTVDPGTLSIPAVGGEGLANITVTPENTFDAAVTFTCSGLPTGTSCTFTPATVTPNGTYPVTTVLAITTASNTALNRGFNPALPISLALAFPLLGWSRRRRIRMVLGLLIATAGIGMLSGCSTSNSGSKAPVTATVTVTATSGTIVQTGTLSLTVQ